MTVSVRHRPVHLNLFLIRFPIAAVMSGAHRISGVIMVLLLPVAIRLLDLSLAGAQGFATARTLLSLGVAKLVVFLVLWALAHHFLAGLRYLALDLDVGIEREQARVSALGVLALAPVLAVLVAWGIYA
jgi:succinate dehydrogenase / fumarate reductase, cytochrome b subunit